MPCRSRPSCWAGGSSTGSPWSHRPSTSRPSGPTPPRARHPPRPDVQRSVGPDVAGLRRRRRHLRRGRVNPLRCGAARTVKPTLVILDEIHHGGDARSWGDGIREAFEPAKRRLSLTGTPFRSDTNPIPFVTYEPTPTASRLGSSDYTLRLRRRRCVTASCARCSSWPTAGACAWRTKAGDEVDARLGEPLTKDVSPTPGARPSTRRGSGCPAVLTAAETGSQRGAPPRRRRRWARHRLEPDSGQGVCRHPPQADRRGPDRRPLRRPRREQAHRAVRRE